MKIISLSEGSFTIDKSKKFIPFDIETDELNSRPTGSLLVEIQPFLVITTNDVILLDTGLGFVDATGQIQLFDSIKKNGFEPEQVTKVLISHLHKDHSGAISNPLNRSELSFSKATYYVNKKEFDHAIAEPSASYFKEYFEALSTSEKVVFLDDEGDIDDFIHYQLTGGHSIYHQVFWIRENNEIIFFGGDVAPQLQQMKSRFVAKYDFDGKKSMELRRHWAEAGEDEKWTFLFYHDIKNPVYQL